MYTHTRGPWSPETPAFEETVDRYTKYLIFANHAEQGERLPAVAYGTANANLIAAAPDLLEALVSARAVVYEEGFSTAQIDAAIAKARGEA